MNELNNTKVNRAILPVKVVQFGEGNFLRAFVEWFINGLNQNGYNSGVAIVQPIEHGLVDKLNAQNGLYHHLMQGIEDGETIDEATLNTAVQQAINPFTEPEAYYTLAASPEVKLIFSNTTEAGIIYDHNDRPNGSLANTFPGKLLQFLKKRFDKLGDSEESAIGVIPCELIESNGDKLKKCLHQYTDLWGLNKDFKDWLNTRVHFANTLVDRIVPGYPKEEIDTIQERIGYHDQLVVKSESFHLFVIEGDDFIQQHFPAHKHGFNVKYVKSITPYRTQKVRILNGSHTSMVPVGLLAGIETVKEAVEHPVVGKYIEQLIFEEIIPTIDLPDEDPAVFARQVIARFKNPFIRHELKSISLNSISKWKVRVLPTLLDYQSAKHQLPKRLAFSLAALIKLYLSDNFVINDDEEVVKKFSALKKETLQPEKLIHQVLCDDSFWGRDLTQVEHLTEAVITYYKQLDNGAEAAIKTL